MHFKNSWPYIQGHLLASRVPSTDPLPVQPPTGPLPVDPPSEVQTLLHVDMDMLENEPPPEPANVGRGWLGRLVSAGRHISVKAAETVGTAVGETVLTVRERIQQRQAEAEAAAALAAAAPAAAPAADGAEGPRFKGLFGRVAGEGDHASAAEIGERLNWVSACPARELRGPCARCCPAFRFVALLVHGSSAQPGCCCNGALPPRSQRLAGHAWPRTAFGDRRRPCREPDARDRL